MTEGKHTFISTLMFIYSIICLIPFGYFAVHIFRGFILFYKKGHLHFKKGIFFFLGPTINLRKMMNDRNDPDIIAWQKGVFCIFFITGAIWFLGFLILMAISWFVANKI